MHGSNFAQKFYLMCARFLDFQPLLSLPLIFSCFLDSRHRKQCMSAPVLLFGLRHTHTHTHTPAAPLEKEKKCARHHINHFSHAVIETFSHKAASFSLDRRTETWHMEKEPFNAPVNKFYEKMRMKMSRGDSTDEKQVLRSYFRIVPCLACHPTRKKCR